MLYDPIIGSLLIFPFTKKTGDRQRYKFCLSSGEKDDQTVHLPENFFF